MLIDIEPAYVAPQTSYVDNLLEGITIDAQICNGKPLFRGLRYPVEMLLEPMSSGMTTDEILAGDEDLEREDPLATISYATRSDQASGASP